METKKPEVSWIKALAEGYRLHYSALRTQQETDQKFYDDEFDVNIDSKYHIKRTGTASKMVDVIAEHIETSNPQAFREPKRISDASVQSNRKISRFLNFWLSLILPEIEDAVKSAASRGEGFFQIDFNDDWREGDIDKLPFIVLCPDPMTIYADPVHYRGVPAQVIKEGKMSIFTLKQQFPAFKTSKKDSDTADYLAYWNKDWRYVEADGQPLIDIQKNILGIVPFVHFYSGYGKRGSRGQPEKMAVSRITKHRSKLIAECEIESRLDSIIGLWANPFAEFKVTEADAEHGLTEEVIKRIPITPGYNFLTPYGIDLKLHQGEAPPPEMFHQAARIKAELGLEIPPISQGIASGSRTSGRLEDITGYHFSRKYVRLISNVEEALARTLGLCLRGLVATNSFPLSVRTITTENGKKLRSEDSITEKDIDGYYECRVELRPEQEIQEDRKVMLGRVLLKEGRISWKYFLTEYKGMTEHDAEELINETIAEQIMLTNPLISQMIGREAVERVGGKRYLRELDEQTQTQGKMQAALQQPQEETPRIMATDNPTSIEAIRQMLEESNMAVRSQPEVPVEGR